MKKLIVANWKLNPQTYREAETLAKEVLKSVRGLKNVEAVLCPPFTWLTDLSHAHAKRASFGAQDVFWAEQGAYTGEISPTMLKNSKVEYAIIGHSERRRHVGETDGMVNRKVLAAMARGLNVILCVGESLTEHKRGETKSKIRGQLRRALKGVKPGAPGGGRRLSIAYEPIWAIGTGLPETPANADNVAKFIRKELGRAFPGKVVQNVRILYGGSVNSGNIVGYLAMTEIAGALVGGASLNAKDFGKILAIANALD